MTLRKRPLAAGIAALLFSSWVSAIGLGDIILNSALNEPLDAEIKLLNVGDISEAELLAGLGSAEDFALAGVDKEFILTRIKFDLDLEGPKGPLIRVTSQDPIREPYLDFLVELEWPSGRLLREYTLLLDLPVFSGDKVKKPAPPVTRAPAQRQSVAATDVSERSGDASPGVAGGETYVVQNGDTLWSIASRLSGEQSTYNKMAAIEQLNPGAFIAGDINRIKRGHVLRVPNNAQIAGADRASLTQRLQQSAAQDVEEKPIWNATAEEKVAPATGSVDSSQARLSLSAGSRVGGVASGTGENNAEVNSTVTQDDIQNIAEELDKTNRENAELKERLSNLEEQLATMEKMLTLQDDGLAAVQQGVGIAEESTAAGQPADDSSSDEMVPEPAGEMTPANNVVTETAGKAADEVTTSEPETKKITLTGEQSLLEKLSDYLVYGLVVLVVLIGAVIALVFRKRRQNDDFPIPDTTGRSKRQEPAFETAEDSVEEEVEDSSDTDFHVGSIDEIELREEDDFFAEEKSPDDVFMPDTAELLPDTGDSAEDELVLPEEVLEQASPSSPEPSATDVQLTDTDELEIDLSEFDVDDSASTSAAAVEEKSLEQALNLDELDFLGGADAAETQLELAQAYIDMGDTSGAREILDEVLESGNEDQISRATELKAQLSSD